jgi:hypothetical protein
MHQLRHAFWRNAARQLFQAETWQGGGMKASVRWLAIALVVVASCKKAEHASAPRTYPDGPDGLKALVGDVTSSPALGDALVLPDPMAYFSAHFPLETAARLAAEYQASPPALGRFLTGQGGSEIRVERLERADDPAAVGYQEHALTAMKAPVALYSVRLRARGQRSGRHLYSFVRDGEVWRYLGPMKQVKPELAADPKFDAIAGLRARDRQTFFNTGRVPE